MFNYINQFYLRNVNMDLAREYCQFKGVYGIFIGENCVYVGRTNRNFPERWIQHKVGMYKKSEKKYELLAEIDKMGYVIAAIPLILFDSCDKETKEEIDAAEVSMIRKYKPILNSVYEKMGDEERELIDISTLVAEDVLRARCRIETIGEPFVINYNTKADKTYFFDFS